METTTGHRIHHILKLFPKPLAVTQVTLVVENLPPPAYPSKIQRLIDKYWQSQSGVWNGKMLGLIKTESLSPEQLTIYAKPTDFKTYIGTNLNPNVYSKLKNNPEQLSNGLVVTAIIVSSDNRIILGIRQNGKLNPLGGTLNTDETYSHENSAYLFAHLHEEINQESGIPLQEISLSNTRLLAISFGVINPRPLITFIHNSPLTASQIFSYFNKYGNHEEHQGLSTLPANASGILGFIKQSPDLLSNTSYEVLDLYLKYLLSF